VRLGYDLPATGRQRLLITRLCMALKIREPLEENPMTTGVAGRLIRELQAEVKSRRRGVK